MSFVSIYLAPSSYDGGQLIEDNGDKVKFNSYLIVIRKIIVKFAWGK